MKNKYICWIVDNYAVCLSVIFIWNLFEVVGKVHVGPLILNLFVCLFVFGLFCFFVLFCFFFETDPNPSCLCVARVFASIKLQLSDKNISTHTGRNFLFFLWSKLKVQAFFFSFFFFLIFFIYRAVKKGNQMAGQNWVRKGAYCVMQIFYTHKICKTWFMGVQHI